MDAKTKKIVGGVLIGLVGVTAGAVGFDMYDNSEAKISEMKAALDIKPTEIIKEVKVPVEVVKEVVVEKEVEVEVEKIVEVDNGKLSYVLQKLEDKEIFEDAKQIVAELEAEDVAIAKALKEISNEAAEALEDEGIVSDEDDVEVITVYNDYEDINITKADYDYDEYKFVIDVKVEDTKKEEKFLTQFTVKVEDGKAEILKVEKV